MKSNSFAILTIFLLLGLLFIPSQSFSQTATDLENKREDITADRQDQKTYKVLTVDQWFELLRERAQEKLKKNYPDFNHFEINAGANAGYESNPLNVSDHAKSASFTEENLNLKWKPVFRPNFAAEAGIKFYNQNYTRLTDIDNQDLDLGLALKYYPLVFERKLLIQPGVDFELGNYPQDNTSNFVNFKPSMKLRYTLNPVWTFGAGYENSDKHYSHLLSRDSDGFDINEAKRHDRRDTYEIYTTCFLRPWSVRLREKIYRNTSNDHFQQSYDYYSYRTYLTLGIGLWQDKIYLNFTPNFEYRDYDVRLGSDGKNRKDHALQYNFDVFYQMTSHLQLNYTLTHKTSNSNDILGEYTDITNSIGITFWF